MGSKRSLDRMQALRQRLYDGMRAKGITGAGADEIWDKIKSFASFGFPDHPPNRHVSEPKAGRDDKQCWITRHARAGPLA